MFVVVAPLTIPSYEPKDIRQDYSEQLLYSSARGSSRLVGCMKRVTYAEVSQYCICVFRTCFVHRVIRCLKKRHRV